MGILLQSIKNHEACTIPVNNWWDIYGTNHPQLKRPMHVTCIGFLDSKHMYTHTQYLHTVCFYMRACLYANVASYLPISLS